MANKTSKKKAAAKAIQRNVEKTVRKSLRKKGSAQESDEVGILGGFLQKSFEGCQNPESSILEWHSDRWTYPQSDEASWERPDSAWEHCQISY